MQPQLKVAPLTFGIGGILNVSSKLCDCSRILSFFCMAVSVSVLLLLAVLLAVVPVVGVLAEAGAGAILEKSASNITA